MYFVFSRFLVRDRYGAFQTTMECVRRLNKYQDSADHDNLRYNFLSQPSP